jgi:quinol monooxygenase YgiN
MCRSQPAAGEPPEFSTIGDVRRRQGCPSRSFSCTHRVKDGKLQDFEKSFGELVEAVEANEPRLIAFNGYVNDEGTEVAVVQVHPDAASMELHMQVAREHITHAYEELLDETTSIQISVNSATRPAR